MTDAQSDAAHGILAGTKSGLQVQNQFPDVAAELERFVREAFVTGFDWAFRADSILAFVGVIVAAVFVGDRLRRGFRTGRSPASPPSEARSRAASAADCTVGAEARAVLAEILP